VKKKSSTYVRRRSGTLGKTSEGNAGAASSGLARRTRKKEGRKDFTRKNKGTNEEEIRMYASRSVSKGVRRKGTFRKGGVELKKRRRSSKASIEERSFAMEFSKKSQLKGDKKALPEWRQRREGFFARQRRSPRLGSPLKGVLARKNRHSSETRRLQREKGRTISEKNNNKGKGKIER